MDEVSPKNFSLPSGIQVSKGEPGVVKALQKLWQKLQLLEQTRHVDKADVASQKNEWTLPEVQQKLLELQIQYMRSILRQNNNIGGTASVPSTTIYSKRRTAERDGVQLSSLQELSDHIPVRDCSDKNTQTGSATSKCASSLYSGEETTPIVPAKDPKDAYSVKHKKEFALLDFHELKVTGGPRVRPRALNLASKQKNLSSHYHLKLSDVPFLIGTSTSSHSVVANVQKIISMMKVHNKALCSSAPNLARRSPVEFRKPNALGYQRTYSSPDLSRQWDLQNILLCLTDELKTLTLRLENMKMITENPPSSELSKHLHEDYANTLNLIEMKTKQIAALHKALRKHPTQVFPHRRRKSFSESSHCSHSTEKLTSESKDISCVNRISKTEVKHVICSFSDASYKADCSDRRKIMRELKEFQLRLQQEDIHWK